MATRDLQVGFSPTELTRTPADAVFPAFPAIRHVINALPGILYDGRGLGKASFSRWVEFALEFPDEVWDVGGQDEENWYHYVSFFEELGSAPAFAVQILWADGMAEVRDFTIAVNDADLAAVRSGYRVYSLSEEVEREARVRLLNERALKKYDENRLEEAADLLERAIALSGAGGSYLFNNRGLVHWKLGKTEQAKRDFLESIRLDSRNSDAHFNLGLIYSDEADYASALMHLERAVALEPGDPQYIMELGHLYLDLEREEEALELYGRIGDRKPYDAQVYFHLGYHYLYRKNHPRKAARYLSKGLETRPGDQYALADLAVAHWVLGHKHKSRGIQSLLRKQIPLTPYTVSRLVYLSMETGDYERAIEYYHQAMEGTDPFEPEWLHYHAAVAYAKTGRREDALRTLSLALQSGEPAIVEHALAERALRPLRRTRLFKELVRRRKRLRSR